MSQQLSFNSVIESAAKLPFVHIDRTKFLTNNLSKFCTPIQLQKAIVEGTLHADIPIETLDSLAYVFGESAPDPTPDSWATDKNHHLSIQIIELEPRASYSIPAALGTMNRSVYFYNGETLLIDGLVMDVRSYAFVTAGDETCLENIGAISVKVLLLESEPIPEPIVAYGPFVMTTQEEIKQAYKDYQETEFGGWPFKSPEIYHGVEQARFAQHADGSIEYPGR